MPGEEGHAQIRVDEYVKPESAAVSRPLLSVMSGWGS